MITDKPDTVKLRRTPNERYVTRRTKINHINHYKNLVEGDYICFQERKIAVVVNNPVLKAITVKGPQVILYEDKDLEIFPQPSGSEESTNKRRSNSKTENLIVEGYYICFQERKIAVVVNDPVLKAITVKGPKVILYEDKHL